MRAGTSTSSWSIACIAWIRRSCARKYLGGSRWRRRSENDINPRRSTRPGPLTTSVTGLSTGSNQGVDHCRCLHEGSVVDSRWSKSLAAACGPYPESVTHAAPKVVLADNGSEFSRRHLRAYHHKVRIDFSSLGKSTDNSFIESFDGSPREECLNTHWFETLDEAQQILEAWQCQYL